MSADGEQADFDSFAVVNVSDSDSDFMPVMSSGHCRATFHLLGDTRDDG